MGIESRHRAFIVPCCRKMALITGRSLLILALLGLLTACIAVPKSVRAELQPATAEQNHFAAPTPAAPDAACEPTCIEATE